MSEAKEQGKKTHKGRGADPTRSLGSLVAGPGRQIGQFIVERELERSVVVH